MRIRVTFLVGLFVFASALQTPSTTRASATQTARPNVLLIMSDDLNTDIGPYNHPIVQTPNLDRLAARGVAFSNAYTQYAWCNPSRASLMTGRRPDSTGVYDLTTHFRANLPDAVTLPQVFRRNGYVAARVGKIYHYGVPNGIGTSGLDDPPSWDSFANPKGIDVDEHPKVDFAGPSRALGNSLSYYASPSPDEQHTDGMVATETIALLERHKDRPFFIAAGFYRPHSPYIAPQKYFDQYDLQRMPATDYASFGVPSALFQQHWEVPAEAQRAALRGYYASVSFMDAQVGRILAAVERLGLWNSTIVVFMSDHGYDLGDHGGAWHKPGVFERTTRTPLIIAAPASAGRGTSPRTVELLDLYPTLADLAGLTPPPELEGRSLRPLLANPRGAWDRPALSQMRARDTSAGGAAAQAPWIMGYSLRTERWRYIAWDNERRGVELYDELNDPGENRNIALDRFYGSTLADLRLRLAAMTSASRR